MNQSETRRFWRSERLRRATAEFVDVRGAAYLLALPVHAVRDLIHAQRLPAREGRRPGDHVLLVEHLRMVAKELI